MKFFKIPILLVGLLAINTCSEDRNALSGGKVENPTTTNTPLSATPSLPDNTNTTKADSNSINQQINLATATVDTIHLGRNFPQSFLGWSHEWRPFPHPLTNSAEINPVYMQLLKNLTLYQTGAFIFHIGGNSSDSLTQSSDPNMLQQLQKIRQVMDVRYIYGVNLKSNDAAATAAQIQAGLMALGPNAIVAFEMGNEPNLWPDFNLNSYNQIYNNVATTNFSYINNQPWLAATAYAGIMKNSNLTAVVDMQKKFLNLITMHKYVGNSLDPNWTAPQLLNENYIIYTAEDLAPNITSAHAAHLPIRLAEMNSLANGGLAGVTDTLADALWTLDTSLTLSSTGLDGINFHNGNGAHYNAIEEDFNGALDLPVVRPSYYAHLLFQQAVAQGVQVLPVSTQGNYPAKTWAFAQANSQIRVVIINKGLNSGIVTIKGFKAAQNATLTYLSGPSLDATTGITLNGQTFDNTPDGLFVGEIINKTTTSDIDGTYKVPLAVGDAVMMVIANL